MSFYCKKCGHQSMNEPFENYLCDECWDKTLAGSLYKIKIAFKLMFTAIYYEFRINKIVSWFDKKIYKKDNNDHRSKWDY